MHHRPLTLARLAASILFFAPFAVTAADTNSVLSEIRAGVLYHDPGFWGGTGVEDGIDFNAELIFSPSLKAFGGVIRPVAGLSVNDQGNTSKIYASAVYEYRWKNGFFIDLGLGIALHDGEIDDEEQADKSNLLGSPVLFRLSIEPGITFKTHHRISLLLDHVSNGYLIDPNEGLDTLGVRYGYQF